MAPPLSAWHDYFMLVGGASATLIGAMFVVVSIGIGILRRGREAQIRAFLSSTVSTLATVLLGAVVTMVPELDALWFGALVGIAAIVGLAYALHIALGFRQHPGTVASDWFWYATVPPIGYLLLLAAGAVALHGSALGLDLFAAGLALMLVAGIRNAWDMIVFLVTLPRTPE
jgi:hypothetical protein